MKKIIPILTRIIFIIICQACVVYFPTIQSMQNNGPEVNFKKKPWDWNTLSWHNPEENAQIWNGLVNERPEAIFIPFRDAFCKVLEEQGDQNWGIIIDSNGILQNIENSQAYAVWDAVKNMTQVNKAFYTYFKRHYLNFMEKMYKANNSLVYLYKLDNYLYKNSSYNPLLLDLLLYRAIHDNLKNKIFTLDNGIEFQSPCIEHNIVLYESSPTDDLLAKKITFFANRINFFTDNIIYSFIIERDLVTKPFIKDCIKNGYLPVQTQYFSACQKSYVLCNTLILLPLHVTYSTSPEGSLIKKFTLPLAYNNNLKVSNKDLQMKCDRLTFINDYLQERLNLLLPLLTGLRYFNDSVKQALAKLAGYPLQESIKARTTEKHLREELETQKQEHLLRLERFKKIITDQSNTIEALQKYVNLQENKLESDVKIINAYIASNQRLLKKNKKLKEECKVLLKQIEQCKKVVDDTKNHYLEIFNLTLKYEKQIADLNDKHQQEIQNLTDKHNQEIQDLNDKHQQENSTLNQTIQDLNEQHKEKIKTLTDKHEQETLTQKKEIQDLTAKYQQAKKKLYYIVGGSVLLNIVLLLGIWQYMYFLRHA